MTLEKVFILANPRSGSSLLRLMLNSHSQITAPPESGFLQWWFKKYKRWSPAWNHPQKVDGFIDDFRTSKKIETWDLDYIGLRNSILGYLPSTYGELIACVYLSYAKRKNKEPLVIVDKNNYYTSHLSDLIQIWPDAKYVLLVRDGRDVACSYKALVNLRTDSPYKPHLSSQISKIAEEWKVNNERVLNFFEPLPQSSIFVLRYEDLIVNTEGELRGLCIFLGVTFETSMLHYYEANRANEEEPRSTLDWKKKTLEEPDPNNIGKYQIELSSAEIDEFNSIASTMLGYFRYT